MTTTLIIQTSFITLTPFRHPGCSKIALLSCCYVQLLFSKDVCSCSGDRYGVEVEAVFTADQDSWHTFYIASDDNGELWFANTTNALEAQRLVHILCWFAFESLIL